MANHPKPPYRRAPVDHVAEILMHLQSCDTIMTRIQPERLSREGRGKIAGLAASLLETRLRCAEAMEELLGGQLMAPERKPDGLQG